MFDLPLIGFFTPELNENLRNKAIKVNPYQRSLIPLLKLIYTYSNFRCGSHLDTTNPLETWLRAKWPAQHATG